MKYQKRIGNRNITVMLDKENQLVFKKEVTTSKKSIIKQAGLFVPYASYVKTRTRYNMSIVKKCQMCGCNFTEYMGILLLAGTLKNQVICETCLYIIKSMLEENDMSDRFIHKEKEN